MSPGLWFATTFAIGAGAGIAIFWLGAMATGRAHRFIEGRTDGAFHIAAELVTGALLIGGGIATIAAAETTSSKLLFGLGCGTLVYALSEAPGHYLRHGPRVIAVALFATWPFLIAAIVLRLTAR